MILFITGFLLSLSLCLDIGIANATIIQTGLRHGFWPSLMVGVGSAFGDLAYAILSFTLLRWVLNNRLAGWLLWGFGTALLLYLTYRMVAHGLQPQPDLEATQVQPANKGVRNLFLGLALAISSPSAILWFATVGGSIIAADAHGQSGPNIVWFCTGFFVCGLLWSVAVAYLCSQVRRVVNPFTMRLVSFTSAAITLYFAIHVFCSGWARFSPSFT